MEELLHREIFGNSVLRYLVAIGVAAAIIAAARIVVGVVVARLGRSRAGEALLTRLFVHSLAGTRWLLVAVVATYAGLRILTLPEPAPAVARAVALIALFLQVGIWAQRGVATMVTRWRDVEEDDPGRATTSKAVLFVARMLLWAFIFVLVLSALGVEITALLAALGVGGVAAALAVQNVLGDIIASLSIYFDRPFDIGDFIVVGDDSGNVQHVGWRSTRVRSISGELIVFANADLARSRIRNFRRMEERRVVFTIGIEYNLPVAKVRETASLLRDAIEDVDGVRFDRAHFKGYGDFALMFEAVYWVLSRDYAEYMDRQHALNLGIYERFEEHGIPFAFPTRTLHVRQEGDWELAPQSGARARA